MKIDIRNTEFEDLLEKRAAARETWIDAFIIYERFKEGKEEMFARIMALAEKEYPDLNRNELLDKARAREEWTNYLNQKSEAQKYMMQVEGIYDDYRSSIIMKCAMIKGDSNNE